MGNKVKVKATKDTKSGTVSYSYGSGTQTVVTSNNKPLKPLTNKGQRQDVTKEQYETVSQKTASKTLDKVFGKKEVK